MKPLIKLTLATLLVATSLAACSDQSAESAPQAKVAYVASVNRAPFHRTTCMWAVRISPRNLRTFESRDQPVKAGHRPCKVCKP